MSKHHIFINDYSDEADTESTNGCFQGSDYWEPERLADLALEKERKKQQEFHLNTLELHRLNAELGAAEKKGYNKKAEYLRKRIKIIEQYIYGH